MGRGGEGREGGLEGQLLRRGIVFTNSGRTEFWLRVVNGDLEVAGGWLG